MSKPDSTIEQYRDHLQQTHSNDEDQPLSTASRHQERSLTRRYPFILLILILTILAIVIFALVIVKMEQARSKEWMDQFSKASQDIKQQLDRKIKDTLQKVQQAASPELLEIQRIQYRQKKAIEQLKQLRDDKSGEVIIASVGFIESEIQENLNDQRSQIAAQHLASKNRFTAINKQLSRISNTTDPSQQATQIIPSLYTPQQAKQKEEYESKVLSFLLSWNRKFDWLLERFKYNFRFTDLPNDPEPHYHTNSQDDNSNENDFKICGVMPNYKDVSIYAIEHSLNSIFRQNYSNYVAVIFSHPSAEVSAFIENYLVFHKISKANYRFVRNMKTKTAIENIYNAVYNYCPDESIAFILEGGNVLQGREIFRSINNMHKRGIYGFTMSNYFKINPMTGFMDWGWSRMPSWLEITHHDSSIFPFFHLFTFRTQVFKQIKLSDFKDDNGRFFHYYTYPLVIPLLQLSCEMKTRFMGLHLFDYVPSNFNDQVWKEMQQYKTLRSRESYKCSNYLQRKIQSNQQSQQLGQKKQKGGIIKTPLENSAIDLLTNKQGKKITDVLYSTDEERDSRTYFHQVRTEIAAKWDMKYHGLSLSSYNIRLQNNTTDEISEERQQYNRLNTRYQLQKYSSEELPICIIIYAYNPQSQYRVQYNLNSVFRQNYTNYYAIIINDPIKSGLGSQYKDYFSFYNIPKEKYTYIVDNSEKTVVQNIFYAANNLCSADSIVLTLDVGDELVGRNVLRLYNAQFQKLKAGFIYSKSYLYQEEKGFNLIKLSDYSIEQKKNVKFRDIGIKSLWGKSWNNTLFRQIDKSNFLNAKGAFVSMASDSALFIPLMQKACGNVYYLPQATTLNIKKTNKQSKRLRHQLQAIFSAYIQKKEKLKCDPYYQALATSQS